MGLASSGRNSSTWGVTYDRKAFTAYRPAVTRMGQAVVVRTLDMGDTIFLPREMNPFLGYRAIELASSTRHV